MSFEEVTNDAHRKRRKRCQIGVVAVIVTGIVLAIVLGLTMRNGFKTDSDRLKKTFIGRCESYLKKDPKLSRDNNCDTMWSAFEQAYVGRNACDVPPEAYDPLMNVVRQQLTCSTMLFWSKTESVAHAFTENRECLFTLENTLLGFTLNELTWCSKNQSKETFTTDCPLWADCVNNSVRSFWTKASQRFAATACGNVSVMLNGSMESPFSSTSTFAEVEVKNLDSTKVAGLTVLLVTKDTDTTTCENASIKNLQSSLKSDIAYNCRKVPFSRVQGCISDPNIPCGDCL